MADKKFTKNDTIDYLMEEDSSIESVVLLFENSKEVRSFSNSVGSDLRTAMSTSLGVKYRVRQNMLQVGNKKVFLGLKQDEELLLNNYSEERVKYFGEDDEEG